MAKFKVGDIVVIVSKAGQTPSEWCGRTARVVEVGKPNSGDPKSLRRYQVSFLTYVTPYPGLTEVFQREMVLFREPTHG